MPPAQTPRPAATPEGIDRYLKALDRAPVMRADAELEKAMKIRELRQAYWAALFAERSLARSVAVAAADHLESKAASLPKLGRGRAIKVERWVEALVDLDAPCDAADRILADLESQLGADASRATASLCSYVRNAQRRRAALLAVRREFAAANLRLVVSVARRYRGNGFIRFPDLIQEGNVGLMMAIDRFDPRRGFRFSTYAAWWIRHAITRALSDRGRVVRLPVHMIETRAQLRKASRLFQQQTGRKPTEARARRSVQCPPRQGAGRWRGCSCSPIASSRPRGTPRTSTRWTACPEPPKTSASCSTTTRARPYSRRG